MSKQKDSGNPSWTKLGNPQAPGAEQRPEQNKNKPSGSPQKGPSKDKGLGTAQRGKAPQAGRDSDSGKR
jgi:hypothetical protein